MTVAGVGFKLVARKVSNDDRDIMSLVYSLSSHRLNTPGTIIIQILEQARWKTQQNNHLMLP